MPELLLEFLSEEIPARMQRRASENLKTMVTSGLVEAGLTYEGARAFVTPRRIALSVNGLTARSPDRRDERKGPRVDAPQKAIEGFLRGAGLTSIDEATIVSDPKKGDHYVAVRSVPGRPAEDIIAATVTETIAKFPWPKSMRWGEPSQQPGSLRWVRPLHSIVCTFGPDGEEPDVVSIDIDRVQCGNETVGHRFLAPDRIKVRRMDDYVAKLEKAKVIVDLSRRMDVILSDAKNLAFARGLELIEDPVLLEEVAGLVEWPVTLMGQFDSAFLDIPPEVIRTTIRANQKCFVLRDPVSGNLANAFVLVSNLEARDGGEEIVAGNERVIRARLADAKFFYDTDLRTPLPDQAKKLQDIVFHEKLGTQAERVERIERLSRRLAAATGADVEHAVRAAQLAKADLVTEMVGEFPELQGLMGRYYAAAQGEVSNVAAALEMHYKPLGPADAIPDEPIAITVALADKLDTLAGFWAIGETPTGSKDPYALRRAALGIVRIVLSNNLRLPLRPVLFGALRECLAAIAMTRGASTLDDLPFASDVKQAPLADKILAFASDAAGSIVDFISESVPETPWEAGVIDDLLSFFADRLTVHLRNEGARHDLIDAVFSLEGQDDLVIIVKRVDALAGFLDSEDGQNVLAGTKRAANILRAEEKKDGRAFDGPVDPDLFADQQERDLYAAIETAEDEADVAVGNEDFKAAMHALAKLRAPIDAFFDHVLVNAEDTGVRQNRLNLLNRVRDATHKVADFSKIEG